MIPSKIPNSNSWKRHIMKQIKQAQAPLRTITITKKSYAKFKKEYIMHILKDGCTFGQAFCKYYNIYDMFIDNETNEKTVERYIKNTYLNRQQVVRAFVA